jgi:hypothetical protein
MFRQAEFIVTQNRVRNLLSDLGFRCSSRVHTGVARISVIVRSARPGGFGIRVEVAGDRDCDSGIGFVCAGEVHRERGGGVAS